MCLYQSAHAGGFGQEALGQVALGQDDITSCEDIHEKSCTEDEAVSGMPDDPRHMYLSLRMLDGQANNVWPQASGTDILDGMQVYTSDLRDLYALEQHVRCI